MAKEQTLYQQYWALKNGKIIANLEQSIEKGATNRWDKW